MQIAIITSTGGSTFRRTLDILKATNHSNIEFIMVSDRECVAEKIAEDFSLSLVRIEEKDNQKFSIKCKEYFDSIGDVDLAMTFFSRLVTHELFDHYPCVNIHPALLPAFKGFRAIDKAYESKVKFFGSTMHMVDAEMDHGSIIAQIQMPIFPKMTWQQMIDAAHIQDVYLMLLLIDFLECGKLKVYPKSRYEITDVLSWNDRCNPYMENIDYINALKELQKTKNLNVII